MLRRARPPTKPTLIRLAAGQPPSPFQGEGFAGGCDPPLPQLCAVFVGAAISRPPHRCGTTSFVGRDDPGVPRTTLLFPVILRPQAEESASPVPGRHKIGRWKRILRFAQDDGGWSATTPARQAAYQAHPHPSGRWPATFPLGGGRSEKTPSAKPSPHRGEGAPQGRMRGRWTGASPQITRTLQRSGKI